MKEFHNKRGGGGGGGGGGGEGGGGGMRRGRENKMQITNDQTSWWFRITSIRGQSR